MGILAYSKCFFKCFLEMYIFFKIKIKYGFEKFLLLFLLVHRVEVK